MSLRTVRRMAADILKVGESRVYIDPDRIDEASSAMTRADVKDLIKNGVIKRKPVTGKKKGKLRKRKRSGSRKGTKYSRKTRKEAWMERVRALRKLLRELIETGKVEKKHKKSIYARIKGNIFKGKRALINHLKDEKILKEDEKNA